MHNGREIGRFEVFADPDAVRQLQGITCTDTKASILDTSYPLTYPICWLGKPEIKNALMKSCSNYFDLTCYMPVHLGQSFEYCRPIVSGSYYQLDLSMDAPDSKNRIQVIGKITDKHENPTATLEMDLVFISAEGSDN